MLKIYWWDQRFTNIFFTKENATWNSFHEVEMKCCLHIKGRNGKRTRSKGKRIRESKENSNKRITILSLLILGYNIATY